MAALSLRAPPPAAVAAASCISLPFQGAMNVHPLGRRGPLSAPVKLQARMRDSFRSHCEKPDNRLHEPDPEPENSDLDKNHPLVEELLNYQQTLLAALGVRVPPDMFVKEKKQISEYREKLSCSADGRNLDERVEAKIVCSNVQQALDLASKVMDIVHDDPGIIEFSQHTTNQMVRTYATILYNIVDDVYHKKIETETAVLSFMSALRGLGAICHILVQDTVAKIKDAHLKNKITHLMDIQSQEFYKQMNNLEDEVAKLKEQKFQYMVDVMLFYMAFNMQDYIFLSLGKTASLHWII